MTIDYTLAGITNALLQATKYQEADTYRTETQVKLKRCGIETKLIVAANHTKQQHLKPHVDSVRAIQEALKKGLIWNQALIRYYVANAQSQFPRNPLK